MSPLKISYHYISSVTVSSSKGHPVCASCMLPRHVLLGHLDPSRWDRLVILIQWNGITTMLRTIPKDSRSKNVQFLCVLPTGECKMVKIHTYIYICSVTLLQKMSNTVKSHDLPCQGIGLALSTEHCCSSSKVSSSQNTTILEALIF